jgi:cysteinyl-tRNA synthetase
MLQSHYKSPVDFSDVALAEARTGMDRFYATLKAIKESLTGCDDSFRMTIDEVSGKNRELADRLMSLPDKFKDAMDDDFATPKAIGHIFDAVRLVNGYLGDKAFTVNSEACFILNLAQENLREVGRVLGLFLEDPDQYFTQDRDSEARKRGLDVGEIDGLIEARRSARQARDWKRADEIRQILAEKQIIIQDSPAGTTWKIE